MGTLAFGDRIKLFKRIADALKDLDFAQIRKLFDLLAPLLGMFTGPEGMAIIELLKKLFGAVSSPSAQSVEAMSADFEAQAAALGFDLSKLDALLQFIERIIELIRGFTKPA